MTYCVYDKKELLSLLNKAATLDALKAGGIENWEGYKSATASLVEIKEVPEKFNPPRGRFS